MLGFIIWAFVGIAVIAIGIFAFFSKKAVGVWANMEMFEVTDYKKYNYAVGKMLCIFGVVFYNSGISAVKQTDCSIHSVFHCRDNNRDYNSHGLLYPDYRKEVP